jgi:preprotein translocase subunit SecG
VVLAQKSQSDGGMGAAMGGGMAEATFGADTNNVLSKSTINASIAFFVLAFVLYLGHVYERNHVKVSGDALPAISVPAALPAAAPATPAAPADAATTPVAPATDAAPKP